MFEDLKKAQRKRKKKKMIAQRAKAEQAHVAQKKASARPNIPAAAGTVKNQGMENPDRQGMKASESRNRGASGGQTAATSDHQNAVTGAKTGSQGNKTVTEAKTGSQGNKTAAETKSGSQGNKTAAGVKSNSQANKTAIASKKKKKKSVKLGMGTKRSQAAAKSHTPQGYHEKLQQHRKDVIRKGLMTVGIAFVVLVVIGFFMERGSYHNYRILQTSEQEDIISTNYVELDGKVLRYSPEGASLVDSKLQTHWSELYDMENPVADVCGDSAVIADQDGTSIKIFNKNGLTGSVTTSYNIVKVHVSESGLVAAILDGGDETWINYYATDGSLIAENQTKIQDPGYPMDVAISKDGMVMMIAYQFVDGGDTTSYVAFYNFGDVGQNEDDRIVSGYTYDGIVVPQVEYLGGNRSVALRDDGFTIYKGKQIPKESETVEVEDEIISTFYDDDMIGLVFKSGDKDKPYTMQVYSSSGKLKFEKNFNIPYTTIKMSGDHIIMYNSSQMCVLNSRGVEKYSGTIDGTIKNLFKIGWNRYLLVLDTGVNVIKFS